MGATGSAGVMLGVSGGVSALPGLRMGSGVVELSAETGIGVGFGFEKKRPCSTRRRELRINNNPTSNINKHTSNRRDGHQVKNCEWYTFLEEMITKFRNLPNIEPTRNEFAERRKGQGKYAHLHHRLQILWRPSKETTS